MYAEKYFAVVINGTERGFRTNRREAIRHANRLRATHGAYNVWLRPHFRLMSADGSPVNL